MPEADRRSISEMRNLGPACEADLNAVGIHHAEDLMKLGVKEAFIQLLIGRHKRGKEVNCCNAAYLYALHGAIHDLDWRDLPEDVKQDYKAFTAELRLTGSFRG